MTAESSAYSWEPVTSLNPSSSSAWIGGQKSVGHPGDVGTYDVWGLVLGRFQTVDDVRYPSLGPGRWIRQAKSASTVVRTWTKVS